MGLTLVLIFMADAGRLPFSDGKKRPSSEGDICREGKIGRGPDSEPVRIQYNIRVRKLTIHQQKKGFNILLYESEGRGKVRQEVKLNHDMFAKKKLSVPIL